MFSWELHAVGYFKFHTSRFSPSAHTLQSQPIPMTQPLSTRRPQAPRPDHRRRGRPPPHLERAADPAGFDVQTFADALEGLTAAKEPDFDVALVDINLPTSRAWSCCAS